MGVSIIAYSQLEHVPGMTPEQAWDAVQQDGAEPVITMAYSGFEASTRGIPGHDVPDDDGIIANAVYRTTDDTETVLVMRRSYSGYSAFREALADLVGLTPAQVWQDPASYADQPFFELINFADNEGAIGPEAADDLLADFRQHHDLAYERLDEYDLAAYEGWLAGLALAADEGVVIFG